MHSFIGHFSFIKVYPCLREINFIHPVTTLVTDFIAPTIWLMFMLNSLKADCDNALLQRELKQGKIRISGGVSSLFKGGEYCAKEHKASIF